MSTYASLADFNGRIRQNIEASMFQGEQFLGALDTWHLVRLTTTELLILTDQRILLYKKGIVRESTRDYDRDKITNVRFDKGLLRRKLKISGSTFSETWRVPHKGGQEFAAAIRAPEPQPVYDVPSSVTFPESKGDKTDSNADSLSAKTSKNTNEGSSGGIEAATVTNPNAEQFGFDRWHYLTAAGLGLLWITLAANLGGFSTLLLILTSVAMYIDILVMREASTWKPRTWLYFLGLLVGGIGAAAYLVNRYRVTSDTDSSSSIDTI